MTQPTTELITNLRSRIAVPNGASFQIIRPKHTSRLLIRVLDASGECIRMSWTDEHGQFIGLANLGYMAPQTILR